MSGLGDGAGGAGRAHRTAARTALSGLLQQPPRVAAAAAGLRAAGPSGDAAVDAAEAQRVIRSAVLKRALRRPGPEGWIGRVRLLAGLRAATARGCEPWVMAALDQGCLHLLLLGLLVYVPVAALQVFADVLPLSDGLRHHLRGLVIKPKDH